MDGNFLLRKFLSQGTHQPEDSPPCDWIPAVHAGMTNFDHLCITMSAPAWECSPDRSSGLKAELCSIGSHGDRHCH